MKNYSKVLNTISIIILLILLVYIFLFIIDSPLGWWVSEEVLIILFLTPLILSVFSLKSKKNRLAKIIRNISILLLSLAGILIIYIYILASGYSN